jgi:Skp family chaperone for outer membrane proteins
MKTINTTACAVSSVAALAIAATLSTFAAQAAPPAAPAPAANTPAPIILVIDRNAILRASKVGQSIVQQVNGYSQAAEKEFKGQADNLRNEERQLQQQIAILAPDVKAKKIKAFQNEQAAFQQKVQTRQNQIQGGVMQARQQVESALGPILQGILRERHANLLFDRNAIVLGTVNVDITGVAVQRLDQKLPTVKVQLVNPPPGSIPQQQQGQ